MTASHAIETLTFDLTFAAQDDARAQHMRFGDFIAGTGIRAIGEVFDEFVDGEAILRLDSLEVPLGPGPPNESEADLENRLREAVRRAVRDLVAAPGDAATEDRSVIDVAPPVADELVTPAQSDFERLWSFLHHGRLPWQAAHLDAQALEALADRVLEREGPRLTQALRLAPALAVLLARLARQWRDDQLDRLVRLLSPSGGAVAPTPGPLATDRPKAWERALFTAVGGPDADPAALAQRAARRAFAYDLAGARISPVAWARLRDGDGAFLREALSRHGQSATWRARLAAGLGAAQWRELVGLWATPADAGFLLILTEEIRPWRLDGDWAPEDLALVLRQALLGAVFAATEAPLRAGGVVAALVRARADLDGASPSDMALGLAEAWPTDGPAAAVRARLTPILQALAAPPGLAWGRAPSPQIRVLRERLEAGLGEGRLDGAAFASLKSLEPRSLAARLAYHGQSGAWRARFGGSLTDDQWREVVGLWTGGADAELIAALSQDSPAWGRSAATPRDSWIATLQEGLLAHLFVEGRSQADVAALARSLTARVADLEGVTAAAVAQRLADLWPDGQAERLRRALRDVLEEDASPRSPPPPRPSPAQIGQWRRDLDTALGREEIADLAWDAILPLDPAWLAGRLRAHGRVAAWRAAFAARLSRTRLAELLALWLPRDEAAALAALAFDPTLWVPGKGAAWPDDGPLPRQWLLDAALLAVGGPLQTDTLLESLLLRYGRHHAREMADVAHAMAAALADGRDDGSASRLAPHLRRLAEAAPAAVSSLREAVAAPALPRALARRLFEAELAEARLWPPAWSQLLDEDPAFLRLALGRHGQGAAWRRRLDAGMSPAQWRELLGLWTTAADRDRLLALLEDRDLWRLTGGQPDEAIAGALRQALLARLFATSGMRPPAADLFAALVRGRADLEGARPADTARSLAAAWPGGAPPRPLAAGLATLATPPAADPASLEVQHHRQALDSGLVETGLVEPAWTALRVLEPEALAARLVFHGQGAAWRSRFARALTPGQWREVVGLWAAGAEAELILALVRIEAWGPLADTPAEALLAQLREGLLAHLLTEGRHRADVPALARGLAARHAELERVEPAESVRRLLEHWPDGHADGLRSALGDILKARPPTRAARRPAGPLPRALARRLFEAELAEARLWPPAWSQLLDEDPAFLRSALARQGQGAAWRRRLDAGMSPAQWRELLGLWTTAADRDRLLALLEDRDLWRLAGGQPDEAIAGALRQALLARLFATSGMRPPAADLFAALVRGRADLEGARPADTARSLAAAWPGGAPPRPLGAGLATLATPPAADPAGLEVQAHRQALDSGLVEARLVEPAWAALRVLEPEALAARLVFHGQGAAWRSRFAQALTPGQWREVVGLWAAGAEAELILALVGRVEAWGPLADTPAEGLLAHLLTEGRSRVDVPALARALAARHAELERVEPAESAGRLPETERRDRLRRLPAHDLIEALEATDHLTRAWVTAAEATPPPTSAGAPDDWPFLLREIVEEGRDFEVLGFVTRWFDAATEGAEAELKSAWRSALLVAAADSRPIAEALAATGPAVLAAPPVLAAPAVAPPAADATLYVQNAGLVLAGPYVPALFHRLELTADGVFVDEAAAERAIHLLQFLVDAGEPALEHQLSLNKLICGLDLAAPVGRDFVITDTERETVDDLLRTMIERWSIIGRTSLAGLRESFLQRGGVLQLEPDVWRLRVEPRAFDMLLDQIPWGFQTLKLPWMKQVLHVDWR